MSNLLIKDGLFVIQGNLYNLIPMSETYGTSTWLGGISKAHFYLYKIGVENQTTMLQSKIENYTLEVEDEIDDKSWKYSRGFSVVPFVGPNSNVQDEYFNCDILLK